MKHLVRKLATLALCCMVIAAFAACGGGATGGTTIDFWYAASVSGNTVIRKLVKAYNEGQGVTDGVYVKPDNRQNIDKSSLFVDAPSVISIEDEDFKTYAVEGLYTDLSGYYETMPGAYSEEEIPATLTERFRLDFAKNDQGKRMAGKGADIQGIPFSNTAMVYYYNLDAFRTAGINIISASEQELPEKYPNVKPHGYAEYAGDKPAPFSGAETSVNLRGQTVYKVFNNRIPMNWEEFRYLSKCFTKSYAGDSSPTEYGSNSHWWFSYGWTVGGDCIGYNGDRYEFTLADKSANYLVTASAGVTVNNNRYAAGEIIRYEDKINTPNIAQIPGLYALPSQYDALLEFVRLTVPRDRDAEDGVKGYGISTTVDDNNQAALTNNKAAMIAADGSIIGSLDVTYRDKYDLAPAQQYREYRGGSVWYDGEESFQNEYLKVIGETYSDGEYTGELKTAESGTPLTGIQAGFSRTTALVIPKRSDPAKYEAAWKFIRWAASREGQAILCETGSTPSQTELAFSDTYLSINPNRNDWAFSNGLKYGDIGDWSYFENGQWVTDWSGLFNNQLRTGYTTISGFLSKKKALADSAIGNVSIILGGRR